MKTLLTGFLLIVCSLQLSALSKSMLPAEREELLDRIDFELTRRDRYTKSRIREIDSIKALMSADSVVDYRLYMPLATLESALNSDSAVVNFTRGHDAALAMGDTLMAQRYYIHRAAELSHLGAIADGIRDLEIISDFGILPENRSLYYRVGRDLHLTMAEVFGSNEAGNGYLSKGVEFAENHMASLTPDSVGYKISQALVYYAHKNDAMCLATLHELEGTLEADHPEYSLVLTIIGGRYLLRGNPELAQRYLARAALIDLYNADRQGSALVRLGRSLYELGDIARAHNYLTVALDDALRASAKTNCIMVSEALMPVAQDIRDRNHRKFVLLTALVVCLVVAMVLLGRLYHGKRLQVKEMARVRHALATANKTKETYIAEFMNLCSSYMESLEDFNRMSKRKIAAGQSDDLMQLIKSGKVIEEQRRKFYDIFDDSFLAIYPTFIDDVNALLYPDKRIVTPGPNVLSTELRVLAFQRLNIDDTAQIARFLGVSLNTIYTYRNKLRNRALSRDTFESDVMKIGSIQ